MSFLAIKAKPEHQNTVDLAVTTLLRHCLDLWSESTTILPSFSSTYTSQAQKVREPYLNSFYSSIIKESNRLPENEREKENSKNRIFSEFEVFARNALDYENCHINILLSQGMTKVATDFALQARQFDSSISVSDIYQASRNALAMAGLQLLFSRPARLTPAIFAYSMLYPYSDNYLDNPEISPRQKQLFNKRFAQCLRGEKAQPENELEKKIFDLICLIEQQYSRDKFPLVYTGLLAIQRAQEKSLRLFCDSKALSSKEILHISFEKGGTSVLADGLLVAGNINHQQAQFLFGWGAYLQLVDDLQDIEPDLKCGIKTIFSHTSLSNHLDDLTSQTVSFGQKILQYLDLFEEKKIEPLKELMISSAYRTLISAAGNADKYYSKLYIKELERYSPFHFAYLKKIKKRYSGQRHSIGRLLEAFSHQKEN